MTLKTVSDLFHRVVEKTALRALSQMTSEDVSRPVRLVLRGE